MVNTRASVLGEAALVSDWGARSGRPLSGEDVVAMSVKNFRGAFWGTTFPRWSGLAALLGGFFCAVAAFLHSLEPVGCVLAECDAGQPLRIGTPLIGTLGAKASVLILIGVAGLTVLGRGEGRHLRLANVGLTGILIGFALLALASLIQTFLFDGDFPGMPYFVLPGVLAVIVPGFCRYGWVYASW